MSTTVWSVQGMTCAHCVTAVTDEVAAIPGVSGVEVDLASGQVVVTAASDPDPAAIAAAIDEAGYTLVSD